MYSLTSLIDSLSSYYDNVPSLRSLSLSQVILFTRLAIDLRNDILLVQSSSHAPSEPPTHLAPSIVGFLGDACQLDLAEVRALWASVRTMVWKADNDVFLDSIRRAESLEQVFSKHGHLLGFASSRTIWPPVQCCTNDECKHRGKGLKLHTAVQKHAIVLTVGNGPLPAWSIQFRCNGCTTIYHHDFSVRNQIRTYYTSISDIIQIGSHTFAERRLLDQWRISMNTSWVSGSACMSIYQQMYPNFSVPAAWNISFNYDHHIVYDSFILYSLLLDCQRQKDILQVPHDSSNRARFQQAMKSRNSRINRLGQPEKRHRCLKCVRLYPPSGEGAEYTSVSVAVTDGVAIGRFRCSVADCKAPLESTKHRFCQDHTERNEVCCVVNCTATVEPGRQTCSDTLHSRLEDQAKRRGQAAFQLKARLEHARQQGLDPSALIPTPVEVDAIAADENIDLDDVELDDVEIELEVDDDENIGQTKKAKLKALFIRKRTHNEQLLVCPCGMIIARQTFFHSEALPSVAEFIKRVYWDGCCPDHIVFDNNCGLAQHVAKDPNWPKDRIGLAVDVFHFKSKHKLTDTFCQEHCNPASFPELMTDDLKGWWFNTSVAEQTNGWLGKYAPICREMTGDLYDFFLDEMISMRNERIREKLVKAGANPSYWQPGDKQL